MTSTSQPLRVLVIDDSPLFRRQVAGALEASGLSVAEASEGYEALWRVRAEGVFDLILADIHMPNLDGLVFIREVRKLPEYVSVPSPAAEALKIVPAPLLTSVNVMPAVPSEKSIKSPVPPPPFRVSLPPPPRMTSFDELPVIVSPRLVPITPSIFW